MRDYPTLQIQTQLKGNKQLVVRNDMDVNEHHRLSNITQTQIKVKVQLVLRNKDMDVNEDKRLSSITFRHKLK